MSQSNIRTETVVRPGMTLSKMIWLLFKTQPEGYVEKVHAINPFLAEQTFLEIGTSINFPMDELVEREPTREVVRLFD